MWFIVVDTLINNEYASLLFSQTIFFLLLLHSEQVCKSFWKESLTRISNARALSSRSRNLDKAFFRYLWYCGKKTNRMWFSVVSTLIDNHTGHHSGQNLLWNHFLFRHIDKAWDGHFQNLSSRYNHLARGEYLTIIPWARVGYEMIDSQRGA